MDNIKIKQLIKAGYDTVWYYQNVQSGDVSYSLVDPMDLHWSEREMYYSKEVRIEDVPLWGILQLESELFCKL